MAKKEPLYPHIPKSKSIIEPWSKKDDIEVAERVMRSLEKVHYELSHACDEGSVVEELRPSLSELWDTYNRVVLIARFIIRE